MESGIRSPGHQAIALMDSTQMRIDSSSSGSRSAMRLASERPMPRLPLQMPAMVEYGTDNLAETPAGPPFRWTYSSQYMRGVVFMASLCVTRSEGVCITRNARARGGRTLRLTP